MITRAGLVATATLLVSGCGGPDLDAFAALCQAKARVVVYDANAWSVYLTNLKSRLERSDPRYPVIAFRHVSEDGFSTENDFSAGRLPSERPKSKPYRNDFYVFRYGKPIARVLNYNIEWQGFDSYQELDCIHGYPAVYGVRADRRNPDE